MKIHEYPGVPWTKEYWENRLRQVSQCFSHVDRAAERLGIRRVRRSRGPWCARCMRAHTHRRKFRGFVRVYLYAFLSSVSTLNVPIQCIHSSSFNRSTVSLYVYGECMTLSVRVCWLVWYGGRRRASNGHAPFFLFSPPLSPLARLFYLFSSLYPYFSTLKNLHRVFDSCLAKPELFDT